MSRPFPEPPPGLGMIEARPGVFTCRRWTKADVKMARRDYPDWCAASDELAEEAAARGDGLTAEAWAAQPEEIRQECYKCCYRRQRMYKGPVEEFGVYGVRVCRGCEYAYPPDV